MKCYLKIATVALTEIKNASASLAGSLCLGSKGLTPKGIVRNHLMPNPDKSIEYCKRSKKFQKVNPMLFVAINLLTALPSIEAAKIQ